MKKLLLVLTIAAFVACNDSGNTEEAPKADSPAATEQTPVTPPAGDTTHTGDTAHKAGDTSSVKK
jgi:hypothetical protein